MCFVYFVIGDIFHGLFKHFVGIFLKNGLHMFVNHHDFNHQFGRFKPLFFFFLNNHFFSKHQIWHRKKSKEVARNWSGLLIDFFEDPRCHVNRPGSKCLVFCTKAARCFAVLGMGIPLHKRKSMQLIIIGEYLYFRYLKYLVIAFFFCWEGGRLVCVPVFFGHSEL